MPKVTGLTVATSANNADVLPIVQGGESKQVTAELLSRLNWLGTVSESGGVPTGSIIERGSNANGEFVKFADGTLIVANQLTPSADLGISIGGSLYRTGHNAATFPAAFLAGTVPSVSVVLKNQNANVFTHWIGDCRGVDNSSFTYELYGTSASIPTDIFINYLAVGRWY